MSHAPYEEWLAVYPDLTPAERAEVDAHLDTCAACAARLAGYRALRRELSGRPAPRPGARLRAGFADAVARAREEDQRPGPWARLRRATLALGNAAAWAGVGAVAVLLLVGLAISGPQLAREVWPAAATAIPSSAGALVDSEWELTALNGQPPLAGTHITIRFDETRASGRAGCNGYSAEYSATGQGILVLAMPAVELQLCTGPAGVMEQERAYTEALPGLTSYRIIGERLEMRNAVGEVVVTFQKRQPRQPSATALPPSAEPAVAVAWLERLQDLCCPPIFAPDGQTYLTIDAQGGLWLQSLSGSPARQISPEVFARIGEAAFRVGAAAWTPDGAAIVVSQGAVISPAPVYLVDPVGGTTRPLGNTYAPSRLVFDAQGRLVVSMETAFWANDLETLNSVVVPGIAPRDAHGVATELAFSPDGNAVAALEGEELAIVDLRTGEKTSITKRIHPRWRAGFAWSPDGRQLAYATGGRDAAPELWVVGADGAGARRLATREGDADMGDAFAGLAWLPGTPYIVYQFVPSGNVATLQSEYQVISAEGGRPKTLFRNGLGLNLSPDGRLISFVRDLEGAEETGNWVALLDYAGSALPATPTPVPTPAHDPVEGWAGTVVKLDPLAQFDDYFLRQDGERYGIDGSAAGLTAPIESVSQQGTAIRVWGRLVTGVPDVNGRQIVVERLEYADGPVPPAGQIAFVAPDGRLRIVGTDGQSAPSLTADGQRVNSPAWSPDGRRLAYVGQSDDGYGLAYLYDAASGRTEPVSYERRQFLSRVSWSADGRYLVLDSGTSVVRSLEIVEVSTRTFVSPIAAIGYAWSPDGKRLAIGQRRPVQPALPYEIGDSLSLALLEPGLPSQVILDGSADVLYRPLAWLPDGRLLYQRTDWPDKAKGGQDSLWTARLDGATVQSEPARDIPLAHDRQALLARLPLELRETASGFSWAPDGRWVAFQARSGSLYGVYLFDTQSGAAPRCLADGTGSTWRPPLSTAPEPLPTPDYRSTKAFMTDSSTSTSPDGRWRVEETHAFPWVDGVETGDRYYTRLTAARVDGSATWTVVDEWLDWGLGYTTPQVLHWSRDGRYLYFTNRPRPDGCGYLVNGSDLQRVDLQDGQVAEVAPTLGLWLALSPDERTLAAARGGRLTLRDLATGQQREAALVPANLFAPLGKIVWAPDGSALVLTKATDACSPKVTHAILRVDVATLAAKTLVASDSRLFTTEAWPEPGRVLLVDKDKARWWMDAGTGALTRAE